MDEEIKTEQQKPTKKKKGRKLRPIAAVLAAAALVAGVALFLWKSGTLAPQAGQEQAETRGALFKKPQPPAETPCPHLRWENGACAACGEACTHTAWEDGVCRVCGTVCEHRTWESGACTVCGVVCGHPDWEDGMCVLCGTPCPHPAWEDESCVQCGFVCPHERHDADSAVCLVCGKQMAHSYAAYHCVGCGREPMLTELALPENYFEPAEHPGTVVNDRFDYREGNHMLRLYLPYGYEEGRPYNVAIFLHGGRGSIGDTINNEFYSECGGWLTPQQLYDHMIEDGLCEPFIVASVFTGDFDNENAEWLGGFIHDGLLPYLADHYSTYAASGSAGDLRAARLHFAIGGQSNGGRFACYSGMARNFDYIANFCCFSAGPDFISRVVIPAVRSYEEQGVEFGVFFDGAGAWEAKKLNTESAYRELLEGVDSLREGENAFYVEVDHQHGWTSWFACYYNALQLLFPADTE